MIGTRYKVLADQDAWVAWRIRPRPFGAHDSVQDEVTVLGKRPKYKQAEMLCEQSAGQPLEWTRTPEGYAATR